jgi:hypothetical protein
LTFGNAIYCKKYETEFIVGIKLENHFSKKVLTFNGIALETPMQGEFLWNKLDF